MKIIGVANGTRYLVEASEDEIARISCHQYVGDNAEMLEHAPPAAMVEPTEVKE